MAATPPTKYRLEAEYREALRALAEHFHRQGRLPYASEANAIRLLTEDAAKKILGKFPSLT